MSLDVEKVIGSIQNKCSLSLGDGTDKPTNKNNICKSKNGLELVSRPNI